MATVSGNKRENKHQTTCLYLRDLAHQYGPSAKLPTTVQIRQQLGVSITTLDAALRELEQQDVIYRKQGSGLYVSPRLHKSIALVCDPTFFQGANSSPFWNLLIEGAKKRAHAKNESFSFHFSNSPIQKGAALQSSLLHDIHVGQVQGLLCLGITPDVEQLLAEIPIPGVVFAGHGQWVVSLGYDELVRLGVAALARQGCQQLGLWLPDSLIPAGLDGHRIEQFRIALRKHHLEFDTAWVQNRYPSTALEFEIGTQTRQEQGYEMAVQIFNQPRHLWPDGIVIIDDMMTHGALVAMRKLGLKCGQDIRIVSHANRGSAMLAGHEDELTLLEFDPAEVVDAMFGMLELLMNGGTPTASSVLISPHPRI